MTPARIRIRATWCKIFHDDLGVEYMDAKTFDLLMPMPQLLKDLSTPTGVLLVRSTSLFNTLAREGWHLAEVSYSKPNAA